MAFWKLLVQNCVRSDIKELMLNQGLIPSPKDFTVNLKCTISMEYVDSCFNPPQLNTVYFPA